MKNYSTKKSLKASGLALMLCIAMLIGTTFAWFTDSITNSGNKIQAGNLEVTLEEWDGTKYTDVSNTPIFDYDKWEPGYTDVAAIKIRNKGNLALKYKVDFMTSDISSDTCKLAEVIDIYYLKGEKAPDQMPQSFAELEEKNFQKIGTLAQFLNKESGVATGELLPNVSDYTMIALHMQENAGNEYQNLNAGNGFDIVLNATQLNSEEDGFGNSDYDKDAENPVIVSTPSELQKAVDKGGTIELKKDLILSEPLTLKANKAVKFDLNGKTLKANGTGHIVVATAGTELTLSNGTLSSVNSNAAVIHAEGTSSVSVENCKINYSGNGGYAVSTNGGLSKDTAIIIKDTDITYEKGYACYFPAGNVTLNDCNVRGAVIISGGHVTINGGVYTADGFSGQPHIWHKDDTISYMKQFSSNDGCGHMGDSILIMDRRSSGYEMQAVTIQNVTFNTELLLKDGSKASAYAIKYVDYNNVPGAQRVNVVNQNNTYTHKLSNGDNPLMFIGIDGTVY